MMRMVEALRVGGYVLGGLAAGAAAFCVLAQLDAAWDRRRRQAAGDEAARSAWTVQLRILTLEAVALFLFTLAAPLGLRRRRAAPPAGRRVPVLLLHGYGLPRASMLWLARRLRRDGWPCVHVLGYRAAFGRLERAVAVLARAVERVRREAGTARVDLVAHSLGGLVARAYVRGHPEHAGVRRLVTLGTPHQGTDSFRWFGLDPMLDEVRPGSAPIRRLAADDPVPGLARVVSVYTADDVIVVPPSSAAYAGATNVALSGVGHMGLLLSPRVYDLVRRSLTDGTETENDAASSGDGGLERGARGA